MSVNGMQKRPGLEGPLLLHNAGATVATVTFDGAASNMAMARQLGCCFNTNELTAFFLHPVTKDLVMYFSMLVTC